MPKPYFPPTAPNVLVWTPVQYGYTALAAGTLGNEGSSADGFEQSFGTALNVLSTIANAHASMDPLLSDLDKAALTTSSISTDDITNTIATALPSLDAGLQTLAKLSAAVLFDPNSVHGIPPAPLQPTITGAGVGSTGGGSPVSIGDASNAAIIGTTIGIAAKATASLLPAIAGTLSVVAKFAPIVAAVVAVGLLLLHFFGGGCGTACTDASRAEQIYEAAADNIFAVERAGMITLAQAVTAMQQFIQGGVQHESQWTTQQAKDGAKNLTYTITNLIVSLNAAPPVAVKKLDMAAARKLYVMSGNWYYESLQAAAQLTDTYLENLPKA